MLAGRLILRARNVQARREELRAGRAAEGTGWSWIPEGKAMMGDDKAYSTRNAQHCMNAIDRGINFTTRFHAWSQTYQSQRSLQEWTDRIEIPDGDPIILKATHTPAHGEFLGSFNLRVSALQSFRLIELLITMQNNANEMVTIPYNACPGYQWLSFDDELPRCGRMPSVDYLMEGVNAFEWTAYSEDDQVRLQDFFTATLRHWTSRTWKTEEDEASRTHLSLGASGTVSLEATIDPSIRPDSLRPLWVGGRAT